MILLCWSAAVVFPALTLLGGTLQPISMYWQPAVIGVLFLAGQLFTLLAVERGDVSIAAPVLGIKILIVPAAVPFFVDEQVGLRVWVAAAIAVVGIVFVQSRDRTIERSLVLASVGYALLAACSMTLFDLLIQRWAPTWGAGYFLPIAFAFAAVFSLAFVHRADSVRRLQELGVGRLLLVGSILMAIQAIGMTLTIGLFGDVTRVNIVYSLRGLWGVLVTWLLASRISSQTAHPGHRTMGFRLIGAVLIGVAVVVSVTP